MLHKWFLDAAAHRKIMFQLIERECMGMLISVTHAWTPSYAAHMQQNHTPQASLCYYFLKLHPCWLPLACKVTLYTVPRDRACTATEHLCMEIRYSTYCHTYDT